MKVPLAALSLVFLGALPLPGQTAQLRVQLDRNAADALEAPATLYVLEAKGAHTLANGFTALLQSEALRCFEVPVRSHTLGSGTEKELVSKYRLLPKPQWVLINPRRSALVAQGEAVPDVTTFAGQLHQAGFRDRVKDLRTFLKEFPRSLEARDQLLNQLRLRGERTAQRFMGIQVAAPREWLDRGDLAGFMHGEDAPEKVDLSGAKALNAVQDFEAWGDFAHELDQVFGSGEWREMDFAWVSTGRPLDAASPTLRSVYKRWQPAVEEALRREPESATRWGLWIWMSQAQGGKPLGPLLASIEPSPLTPKEQWPPDAVVRALFSRAHSTEEWRTLKGLYQARWDYLPHTLRESAAGNAAQSDPTRPGALATDQAILLDHDWTLYLEPLLECCMRGGDPHLADTLLTEAMNACRWSALPEKGAAVARRCGQSDLAVRWSALRPGSPQ